MSNKVWVTWKSGGDQGKDLVSRVGGLADDDLIDDLRKAFVSERKIHDLDPATLTVETSTGKVLQVSTKLKPYFVPTEGVAFLPGPGKAEDTALFVRLPPPQDDEPSKKKAKLGPTIEINEALEKLKKEQKFLASFRKEFIENEDKLLDNDMEWKLSEDASKWAQNFVKLCTSPEPVSTGCCPQNNKVVDLGEDIQAFGMTIGIDEDSKKDSTVFLRKEQRDVAKIAVEAVFSDVKHIVITGSPGAGKTFGTLAAIVVKLLIKGVPVLRITEKSKAPLYFFLPGEDGKPLQAWSSDMPADGLWNRSIFSNLTTVVTVIDPGEGGTIVKQEGLSGRSIKVPSDNEIKHYENMAKLHQVLYTSPPTAEQALVMCRCLVTTYDDDSKPIALDPKFLENSNVCGVSVGNKVSVDNEIRRRVLLVGPYPRYVIKYSAFKRRVGEIRDKVQALGITIDSVTLATLNIAKNLQLESGRLQSTYPKDKTREERVFKLHPLAMYEIAHCYAKREEDFVNTNGKAQFGWFFEKYVCLPLLKKGFEAPCRELQFHMRTPQSGQETLVIGKKKFQAEYKPAIEEHAKEETHKSGYAAIGDLDPEERAKVLVLPTCNFPFADFGLARYWFVNAKVGKSTHFKCTTALSFLQNIGVLQNDKGTWKSCKGMETKVVELDLIGVNNLSSWCVFEGSQAELKIVKKHLKVTNVDVGAKTAGNVLFASIKKALSAYGLDKDINY